MASAIEEAVVIQDRFPSQEPTTLPMRGHSGTHIKPRIIRAMAEQIESEKKCFSALDTLNRRLQTLIRKRQRNGNRG